MPVIKFSCIGCNARYSMKAPTLEGLASKPFRCPKCGFTAPFRQIMGKKNPPFSEHLHTHIGGQPGVLPNFDQATKISGVASAKLTLEVEGSGKALQIGIGNYTVGRDSYDSQATLKIAPDRYMSRMHAIIQVSPSTGANMNINSMIKNISSSNPIFINGQKINSGQAAPLKNGDCLVLGMTKINVKI